MPNEKEVRDAAQRRKELGRNPVCSVSVAPCADRCLAGGGCQSREPKLDPVPTEVVRELRTARLYIQAAQYRIDDILGGEHLLQRKHPAPEMREVRRKLSTAIAMIDEIGGEL